jgi:hypothetical protein
VTSLGKKSISYLGSLHGEGTLLVQDGRQLGEVIYEIDGYLDHGAKSANGQIQGERQILETAFRAEEATIVLESGRCIHIVVSNPFGDVTAEIRVTGSFPL